MKVKVSVYHGPSGSGRTDLAVPFVPGKTTVGQALEEAASRLAASGGAKEESGTDENGPPIPNLQLIRMPSRVSAVSRNCRYLGEDWMWNDVSNKTGTKIRYHVVPALVSSDEEGSDDESGNEDSKPKSIKASETKKPSSISRSINPFYKDEGAARQDEVYFRAVTSWDFDKPKTAMQRNDVFSSRLYEYHSVEGLSATTLDKITAIRVPLDDNGSFLRIDLTETAEMKAVFKEQQEKDGQTSVKKLNVALARRHMPGGATIEDLKSVGK